MQITVNGVSLNYELAGNGPPVVFIHGMGESLSIWKRQTELFRKNYAVLAYDLRGYGLSSRQIAPKFSLELWTEDLYELLSKTGMKPCCLVGHSLGASIAMLTCLKHPEDVRGLILIGAAAAFGSSAVGRQMTMKRIDLIRNGGMRNYVENMWDANPPFAKGSKETIEDDFNAYRDNVLSCNAEAYIATCEALLDMNLQGRLGEIKCPALIITGESDDRTTVSQAEALNRGIALSAMEIVPDASHSVMIEQPHTVNSLMQGFLSSIFQ